MSNMKTVKIKKMTKNSIIYDAIIRKHNTCYGYKKVGRRLIPKKHYFTYVITVPRKWVNSHFKKIAKISLKVV